MRARYTSSIACSSRRNGRKSATRFSLRLRLVATCVTLLCLAGTDAVAADLRIWVIDRSGRGVEGVVATATPQTPGKVPASETPSIMDQRNLAFAPRVLVVRVGTSVEFPNNDSVSHQVYSFSPAKRFQLPLYKGGVHAPVRFDQPGLVVLGCNIHDSMVGYIYVTEAPWFAITGADGDVQLRDLAQGDYRITLWSPYIADTPASLSRDAHVGAVSEAIRVRLTQPLRSQPEPRPHRRDWEY